MSKCANEGCLFNKNNNCTSEFVNGEIEGIKATCYGYEEIKEGEE